VDLLRTFVSRRVQPLCQRDDYVDVSGAKFSRLPLLRRVGRYDDQHPNPRGPFSWGQSKFQLRSDLFNGRGRQPLSESARAHFHLLVSISTSQHIRVLLQDLG
jgi:hypothetical protein